MTPTFSSPEEFQAARRRRLILALSACALLLLLLAPTLHYFSLLGASVDPAIAGDVTDDSDDDLSDGAGAISQPKAIASGWSKRSHSMVVAGVLDTRAEAIVIAESFDEWIALQPFRQTSAEDRESAEESSGDGQRVASLFGPAFAELSDAFGTVGGDFNLGSGWGLSGAGGSGAGSAGLRARRLVVDSTRGSGGVNATDSGDSSAAGGAGNGNGNNAGANGGVGFVPGGDLTGDPADTNVSLVVTDPSTDAGETGGASLPTNNAPDVPSVPEPTGLVLLGSGLVFAAHSLRTRITRRPKQRLAIR